MRWKNGARGLICEMSSRGDLLSDRALFFNKNHRSLNPRSRKFDQFLSRNRGELAMLGRTDDQRKCSYCGAASQRPIVGFLTYVVLAPNWEDAIRSCVIRPQRSQSPSFARVGDENAAEQRCFPEAAVQEPKAGRNLNRPFVAVHTEVSRAGHNESKLWLQQQRPSPVKLSILFSFTQTIADQTFCCSN